MAQAKTKAMRAVIWTAAVIFVLDQLSKYIVVHMMQLDRKLQIDVLPPWLQFRMAWNQGINFGLFANSADVMRWVLIALALAISAWVWIWMRRGELCAQGRFRFSGGESAACLTCRRRWLSCSERWERSIARPACARSTQK